MSEINENQRVKLSFNIADGSVKELECSIKHLYKDRIAMAFPAETMYYVDFLQEGDEVIVKIFTPVGIKMFNAIILDSPLEDEFVVEFVESFIEIQRRKYLRTVLKTKIILERTEKENIVTHTFDIGGGGVRFFYKGTFEHNETVHCLLYLPLRIHSVQATGIIIKEGALKSNEHILVFTKIDERERDRIIKKCLELQSAAVM